MSVGLIIWLSILLFIRLVAYTVVECIKHHARTNARLEFNRIKAIAKITNTELPAIAPEYSGNTSLYELIYKYELKELYYKETWLNVSRHYSDLMGNEEVLRNQLRHTFKG